MRYLEMTNRTALKAVLAVSVLVVGCDRAPVAPAPVAPAPVAPAPVAPAPTTRSLVTEPYKERPANIEQFLTPEGIRIASSADRVEVFKLEGLPRDDAPAGWDGGRKVTRTEVVATALGRELATVLVDPGTYALSRGRKKCGGFQPREAVRLWSNNQSITFSICFKCGDTGVVVHDAAGTPVHEHFADFSPGRTRLLALLRRALPNDPYLNSVPEKR